jgi:LysM repeat protein
VDAPAPVATRTPAGGGEATKPAESAKSAERTSTKSYTIKPGDTPSGIAAAHGISTQRLMELNPGLAPESLTVGEKVRVE